VLIAGMQLANGFRITSLDQLLNHGSFGRVALGFDAVHVLRNAVIQNSLHAYSYLYVTPSTVVIWGSLV
jgi:hypothetical protein